MTENVSHVCCCSGRMCGLAPATRITFTAVMPYFAPVTGVGRAAVQAYADRAGQPVEEYLQQHAPLLTPEIAGAALVELVRADAATVAAGYRLSGAGLQELP